mgnify:CR=1 FL=1
MPGSGFDWEQLRAFALVVRAGSLSAATRESGQSTPTLSRRVAALEASLGARLFDRTSAGLVPTPTGTALLAEAEAMGRAADRIALIASGRSAAIAGTVRVTASEDMAAWVLPEAFVALRREEPDIAIEIVASNRTGNLLRREADIAVRMYRPTQGDVVARRVGQSEVCAFAATRYLDRRGRPETFEEMIAGHDIIGYDTDEQIIEGFREHGASLSRDAFPLRCDDHIVCWQLLVAGGGIGFAQRALGERTPGVETLFSGEPVATLPIWLTAHAELRTSARIRRVYDHLADALADIA